ncbi:hypothetical protein G3480_16075 [Thiorhodococcus mannitoliphagus]|uniref:Uncharacterized protein n=1 Tax=Thiorhodococcus mannitoliphagus TaxID=329406 RepID=A0A6P1DVT9_9GAMM|nr:hypothetical protein [Thiorhodococcus mannitoliphagus]NEX21809.1 hypothetical protein [Thiorhodococcus mannitoliphagus]
MHDDSIEPARFHQLLLLCFRRKDPLEHEVHRLGRTRIARWGCATFIRVLENGQLLAASIARVTGLRRHPIPRTTRAIPRRPSRAD